MVFYGTFNSPQKLFKQVLGQIFANKINITDLTLWGGGLCQGGGCKGRKSLKVFMVEVKVIIFRVLGHVSMKIMLKISRERRKQLRKISILGIKKHRSAAVRGGAGCAPPPLDPLVHITSKHPYLSTMWF